ncbi:MAG: hypothetical protein QG670_292 [Thermoproteota archaeon]|nr:hypothetical protein [Thermoproteota archaeon]
MGKLSNRELHELLSCVKNDPRVVVPPKPGYDSGVNKIGDRYLVVKTDPCTGVPEEWFGFLLVNYAASDVAIFGAKPEYCTLNLLGPAKTQLETFKTIMRQACKAADELGIAIVTGHTGRYNSIRSLVGVCTVYGEITPAKLKTPRSAAVGDLVLCTKPIGLEAVVNFSLIRKGLAKKLFGGQKVEELTKQVYMQSCVNEALQLAESRGINAMHDATEGGLVAALNEMAEASDLGFEIDNAKVPLIPEIRLIQKAFHFSDKQVLSISSTGTILAAVNPEVEKEVMELLEKCGLKASFLGKFTKDKTRFLIMNGHKKRFPKMVNDPYTKIFSQALAGT